MDCQIMCALRFALTFVVGTTLDDAFVWTANRATYDNDKTTGTFDDARRRQRQRQRQHKRRSCSERHTKTRAEPHTGVGLTGMGAKGKLDVAGAREPEFGIDSPTMRESVYQPTVARGDCARRE